MFFIDPKQYIFSGDFCDKVEVIRSEINDNETSYMLPCFSSFVSFSPQINKPVLSQSQNIDENNSFFTLPPAQIQTQKYEIKIPTEFLPKLKRGRKAGTKKHKKKIENDQNESREFIQKFPILVNLSLAEPRPSCDLSLQTDQSKDIETKTNVTVSLTRKKTKFAKKRSKSYEQMLAQKRKDNCIHAREYRIRFSNDIKTMEDFCVTNNIPLPEYPSLSLEEKNKMFFELRTVWGPKKTLNQRQLLERRRELNRVSSALYREKKKLYQKQLKDLYTAHACSAL